MSYDLGAAHGQIVLDYDSDRAVGRAERDIDKLERKAKESDGALSKLGKTLSSFGAATKIGATATAMGAAAVQAGAFAVNLLGTLPELASIASLSAALPGFYAGAAASVLTLKAAFAGVADTIKLAFDPEKAEQYQKALEKLSPTARSFVEAIHDAAPELTAFQQAIQESFFKASFLTGQVPRLVKAFGQLRPQVLGLAADFGEVTRKLTNFAMSQDSIQFLSDSIQVFRASVADAGQPLVLLLKGLRDVGEVGLPLLLQMSDAVNGLTARFGNWLSAVASDGRLQDWIDTALNTLKTLGTIAQNVGTILFNVIKAAQQAGGGLLGTLADVTGQISDFLGSTEGFDAMVNLFSSLLDVAHQLAPAVIALVSALAKALAPAIAQIARDLGPVLLQVIEALAPAFGPLASAIADLVTALAPLLPPIAQLVTLLATALSTAVEALISELGPLIKVIADGLSGAIEGLMPFVASMAQGLPIAAEAGAQLARAFAPLIPVIVKLAQTLSDSLIKAMPDLLDAAQNLIPVIVNLATALSGQFADALNQLIPLIPPLVAIFVKLAPILFQIMTIGLRIVTWMLQLSAATRNLASDLAGLVVVLVQGLAGALVKAYNAVVTAGAAVIGWFQRLPGVIMGALAALPGQLRDFFVNVLRGLATTIGFTLGLIVGIFTRLPGRIAQAVASLGPKLWALMQETWAGLQSRINNGINNALAVLRNFPRRAYSAMVSLVSQLRNVASNAWNGLVSRFNSGVNSAVSTARSLPGRIRSAVGNLAGLLYSSGVNLINGLIRGIASGIGRVIGMVQNLASRVKGAFNSALSIFSPSREFEWSGEMIGTGLIKGLKSQVDAVKRAGQLLANSVIAPTVKLPATASAAAMNVAVANPVRTQADIGRTFGPYTIEVDGKVLASIVIDTITGAPTVVSKAASEGDRRNEFAGSGRR